MVKMVVKLLVLDENKVRECERKKENYYKVRFLEDENNGKTCV